MTRDKMYPERVGNISVFRGCSYSCFYCAFRTSLRRSPCEKCRIFEPHAHLEVLDKTPPKTKPDEFITIGLTGDISFMDLTDFWKVIEYCRKWKDSTFLIQSKKPWYFLQFLEHIAPLRIPDNLILGTTIETNKPTNKYSKAPEPVLRGYAMKLLDCRKEVTIEPITDFDMDIMVKWMKAIAPEICYIGYNSKDKIMLPEPSLEKTQELIEKLQEFTEVRTKLMRKAWWEK